MPRNATLKKQSPPECLTVVDTCVQPMAYIPGGSVLFIGV